MIELKDVIQLWLVANKNVGRSWELCQDPDDTYVVKPKNPKHYKTNARILLLGDSVKMHYDDNPQWDDKQCHSEIVMAYDKEFFSKIARWMRFVRRA